MHRFITVSVVLFLTVGCFSRAVAQYPGDSLHPVHTYAVGFQLSTIGPGLYATRVISQKSRLSARLGVSYFAYRKLVRIKADKASESYVNVNPDLTLGVVQGSLKWHPFKRSSFFVTGGAGYTWHPDMTFNITTDGKLTFGGLEMQAADVGVIDVGFRWSNLLGYGGLGFGRNVPRKRLGFGVELGTYYLGKPRIDLKYEGFLETTTIDQEIPKIERNLSGYRWLPSLQLHLTYAIK